MALASRSDVRFGLFAAELLAVYATAMVHKEQEMNLRKANIHVRALECRARLKVQDIFWT
jgi:hypothetical protein